MFWQHNGCELPVLVPAAQVSGRGPLPHMLFHESASVVSPVSGAKSPVRSSELLGCQSINSYYWKWELAAILGKTGSSKMLL
jgi:hypothetical protein